ncbi:MAG: ABC transporter permease [Acidimicrobiia bacterium]|nr:ABC transporter permease [Acidimicrobiia bacterium]
MNPRRSILLVAARDFKERVTSRAFQLSTGITVLFVVALIVVPAIFFDDEAPRWEVGFVGEVPAGFAMAVETASGNAATVEVSQYALRSDAEAALEEGEVEIAVDADGQILVGSDTENRVQSAVLAGLAGISMADRADELGIDVNEISDLLTGGYEIESIVPESEESNESNRVFAFFVTVVLFMSIVTYGSWILIGVIEEKTNRVVEVVLGTLRPHQLLAGKVLGIGVLGVAQVVVIGIITLILLPIQDAFEVPSAAGSVLAWALVWYVLGFAFYAVAYAAAGSLVSRQEEAQNAAFPLTMMLMAAYFIASFSIAGENPILRAASLLPMFAPMTMPLRIAGGDAATWEIVVSLTLMVVTTYGLIRLAGRVYAGGLLQGAGRVKWREAFRASDA